MFFWDVKLWASRALGIPQGPNDPRLNPKEAEGGFGQRRISVKEFEEGYCATHVALANVTRLPVPWSTLADAR